MKHFELEYYRIEKLQNETYFVRVHILMVNDIGIRNTFKW